ncbi:sarcoplasmic calcium-binding protein, alpha chain isoform X2 [Cylas formicarius]|uniref:sarcoplasmic calcium-binding protein, alpha chain isoform X2 n=1 Tax=Cylas formicarius TaxID=197179 RepID=UPI002958C08E|nr:sarcoplasmic calcium-binding protein, alpha chain isoform X2 [Cylas formicarius]
MAYSWDNRVSFVVKYLYDIDNNGYLDERDFACLALRATIIEGKGEFSFSKLQENHHIMLSLWEEIAELADFNKDGKITVEEFKQAVQQCCMGRRYEDFPQAMKMFIDSNFKMVDLNDDGVIDADEYRFNCITKFPIDDVEVVDEAFNSMLSDDDRRRGGLTLSRYEELYAQFLGNPEETSAVYLFGPLSEFFNEFES